MACSPVQAGIEHVVGVFAGKNNLANSHKGGCMSWCDRAHKADLPSFTTTGQLFISFSSFSIVFHHF